MALGAPLQHDGFTIAPSPNDDLVMSLQTRYRCACNQCGTYCELPVSWNDLAPHESEEGLIALFALAMRAHKRLH
jgi:hypothetical protein